MNKRLLSLMASLLLCGAVSAQSHFEADTHAQDNNMPVVAQVVLDGQTVTTGGYELGAFVGTATEARGSAQIQSSLDNTYWIQVYYSSTDEATATVSFKLYDGEEEYTAETTLAINPEGAGTPSDPVEIVVNRAVTQTAQLAAGWTWWSTPIEMEGNNGLQQLETSINDYGTRIMTKGATLIKRAGNWVGSINALENEKSYKINVSDISTVTITGSYADPSDHPITITNGWNWIGYPVNVTQSVGSALSGLEPQTGDVIMNNVDGSAVFRNNQWLPATRSLTPGHGYMYNSKATGSKTFVYSINREGGNQTNEENHYWIANNHKYENAIVVIAVAYIGEEEQRGESIELAAFVNGDCTGSDKLFYVEDDDRYYAVLTIGGNEGDIITFGMVDESKGVVYNENNNFLIFRENSIVGDFDNPYKICFNQTGVGENTMQVALYPNPVNRGQSFKLNIPQEEEVLEVSVINSLGSILRHETGALKSTIQGLPVAGVYTVKVVCRSGYTYYGRIVVK